MSPGGPRRWIRHNKGRTSHCRLDTSPRWPHHISQLSRHTTDHRRIGPGVLLITYFNIIKGEFANLFHKLSLFEWRKLYLTRGFQNNWTRFGTGIKREAISVIVSNTLTGQYGLHVVIDTVQFWHGPLVVDCLLSDATISPLSSVVTIVSLDTLQVPTLPCISCYQTSYTAFVQHVESVCSI